MLIVRCDRSRVNLGLLLLQLLVDGNTVNTIAPAVAHGLSEQQQ